MAIVGLSYVPLVATLQKNSLEVLIRDTAVAWIKGAKCFNAIVRVHNLKVQLFTITKISR